VAHNSAKVTMGNTLINSAKKPVAVVIGATRWGVGGALAQKFAAEGFFTVITSRTAANAAKLEEAIQAQGNDCMTVELDLSSEESVQAALARIRAEAGEPEALIYNAGYNDGRELRPGMELLEYIPTDLFDRTQHIACRGPFLVAKEVLPAMRKAGHGSFLISNNSSSLRGRKRETGGSLYYPRVMMRTLAKSRCGDQSDGNRERLLLPTHPRTLGLDPRNAAHAACDQAQLLGPTEPLVGSC